MIKLWNSIFPMSWTQFAALSWCVIASAFVIGIVIGWAS